MKRLLYLALLGAGLACPHHASAQTDVYETAKGSATVSSVLITNAATAVQVDVSSRAVTERFTMELWNDDPTGNLWCGFNANVSSTAGNANYGRRVPPRSSWTVAVPIAVKVYCVSDLAAGVWTVLTQLW